MNHHDAEMCDVVVILEDLDDPQTIEVVKQLTAAGLKVENVNNDTSVVEGCILSQKVRDLSKVSKVRNVRSVRSYTVDYPAGDPRDLDGKEDLCDESED